jgi:hypothetical protein
MDLKLPVGGHFIKRSGQVNLRNLQVVSRPEGPKTFEGYPLLDLPRWLVLLRELSL